MSLPGIAGLRLTLNQRRASADRSGRPSCGFDAILRVERGSTRPAGRVGQRRLAFVRLRRTIVALGASFFALASVSVALSKELAPAATAVALIVSVDVSQSVDEARFRLQMDGIAEALEDPAVQAAITGNPGGILFTMVTWADKAQAAFAWRRIASRADALAAAAAVRATPREPGEFTCIGQMLRTVSAKIIPDLPGPAERVVVDVSGDGIDNCTEAAALKDEHELLLATGATINGLPILVPGENDVVGAGAYRAPGYGLVATPLPRDQTSLPQWYRANLIGGPGAFLLVANGYGDFARAFKRKFVLETSRRGEPPNNEMAKLRDD